MILLLKEFRDVFAWNYSEMPRLDPETRPVAQPARVFHTEIEGWIVKKVQKLQAAAFIKPIQHS